MIKKIFVLSIICLLLCLCGCQSSAVAKKRTKRSTAAQIDGIDISHHNGSINWKTVHRQHPEIKFVYIKVTEGATWSDNTYSKNFKQARKNGILAGSYHLFSTKKDAVSQFNNFKKHVKASQQDIIPMVDIEGCGKNPKETIKHLKEFCQLVKRHYGVKPLIYVREKIYNKYLAKDFKSYHLYIAKYSKGAPKLKKGADYTIWQYNEHGKLKGVNENVDFACFSTKHSIKSITYARKNK